MNATASLENKVHILLAVWGEKFIKDFLQYGLLSLLAPLNLPSLAKAYQTKFIILTRSQDIPSFDEDLTFQTLKSTCEVEFLVIDDLISIGNHSTTLTFAFDRAIRATQDEMLRTYFILLNADYIFANGSFCGLMKYMKQGHTAICAGNFQVVESEFKPILKRYIGPNNQQMIIPPRELLKESFEHFHPVTLSSMLDQHTLHNHRANRFFMRESRHTVAGRFYLLHVLCIKPETTNYQIGSSFDYSFVPEMCLSGNIGVINDSDDYLVIEMQREEHELDNVEFGPYALKKLVANLAEWTTVTHRNNVKHIIYYHINDLSVEEKNKIKIKSDQLLQQLNNKLERLNPRPYRNHPYWVVSSFKNGTSLVKDDNSPYYPELSALDYKSKWRKLYHRLFGYPPEVNRFHFRFQEYRATRKVIKQFVSQISPENILSLYGTNDIEFMCYCGWLKRDLKIAHHYNLQSAHKKTIIEFLQGRQFARCILFVKTEDRKKIKNSLTLIKPLLAPNTEILIFIMNKNNESSTFLYDFPKKFLAEINDYVNPDYMISRITPIHSNLSILGTMMVRWINLKFNYSKKMRLLAYVLLGLPALFFTVVRNVLLGRLTHKQGYCTSIFVTLKECEYR
jgi:hypothetical protein